MKILENNYWSIVINIILEKYFSELTTTCILWHNQFYFNLLPTKNDNVYIQINPSSLNSSFSKDVYNFIDQDERYNSNGVYYNDLIKKFIAVIEHGHCELSKMIYQYLRKLSERQARIPYGVQLTQSFCLFKEHQRQDYFRDIFFRNQANILVIETEFMNSSIFWLKTNKFVGTLLNYSAELVLLSTFNAINNNFSPDIDLFAKDKLQDLQGREIIVGAFDYRPFVAVDFQRLPQYYDHSKENPSHLVHVDGAEMRICHTFCEIYNCTLQFDTSEKEEWGSAFAYYSGYGLIGMIIEGKVHMAMGAMYAWYSDYVAIDITTFVGRSGVTCLVPAPTRLVSWTLPYRPFQFTLWLAVCLCLLLETISLLIARRFEQTLENGNNSWWTCIQFGYITTLKLFISQGLDYIVNSNTVRTVLFACYMIDTIITSIYGGGLSAILTLPTLVVFRIILNSLGETADSLERLYSHGIPWTATSFDWVESITVDEEDSDLMFKSLLSHYEVNTFDEMRQKSRTENMGFVLERMAFGHFGNGDFITPEALDRLKLMVDDIYSQFTVVMVPRLWSHLPKFNDLILAWHSSGFDKFWEWKITAEYLNVNEQNQVEASRYTNFDAGPVVLDMKNFSGIMILWLAGIILSVFTFIGEFVYYKRILFSEEKKRYGNRNKVGIKLS